MLSAAALCLLLAPPAASQASKYGVAFHPRTSAALEEEASDQLQGYNIGHDIVNDLRLPDGTIWMPEFALRESLPGAYAAHWSGLVLLRTDTLAAAGKKKRKELEDLFVSSWTARQEIVAANLDVILHEMVHARQSREERPKAGTPLHCEEEAWLEMLRFVHEQLAVDPRRARASRFINQYAVLLKDLKRHRRWVKEAYKTRRGTLPCADPYPRFEKEFYPAIRVAGPRYLARAGLELKR